MIVINNLGQVFINSKGEIPSVTGTYGAGKQLTGIYAAVVPVTFETPPYPIFSTMLSNGYEYAVGTAGAVAGTWEVKNVPGATGDCRLEKVIAWGTYGSDPGCFLNGTDNFRGYRSGSGCGSGTTSGFSTQSTIRDAAPTGYTVAFEMTGVKTNDTFDALVAGGLLSSEKVMLKYDMIGSSPDQTIWRATADDGKSFSLCLRVTEGTVTLEAELSLRRASQDMVAPLLIWKTHDWEFFGVNHLHAVGESAKSVSVVRVEPVQ